MFDYAKTRSWAEIDLKALVHNYEYAASLVNVPVMPVIKGNAHGHGAVECGLALEKAGAAAFGVACIAEAIELRKGGITVPILILGWTDPHYTPDLIEYDITQSAYSVEYAKMLSDAAAGLKGKVKVHAKLDTGMTRTGIFAQNDPEAAARDVIAIDSMPGLDLCGIFTHFATADMADRKDFFDFQYKNYKAVLDALSKAGFDKKIIHHTGNSATIMYHSDTCFDMVRCGVMVYGFYPNSIYEENGPLQPVLSLKARVAQVKDIPKGACVSYGCTFTAEKPMKLAVVSAGYADSYPRSLSNKGAYAVIAGKKCPQVGRICMDMCMFDVSGTDAKEGDEVILYGKGGMPLDLLADLAGTINCEITCMLTQRVQRIFIK